MSEEKKDFALGKQNLLFMAIAFALVILGFVLMSGSVTEQKFNEDIFSTRRIVVGPMISLFGFVSMAFAILWKSKK